MGHFVAAEERNKTASWLPIVVDMDAFVSVVAHFWESPPLIA